MIDVHLLRYALAAADSGSFSRAADQFCVKQTTLSKRIRYLEHRLGVSLFTRSTQGVAPTQSGLAFLARARTIIGELDLLSADTLDLAKGTRGKLRIGFHCSLAAGDLRATLEDYRREVPGIEFEATETCREELLQAIDRDRLDVAIIAGEAAHMAHRTLSLWSEPLMLGFQLGHPLLERDQLYWTDLRGLSFLATRADPGALIVGMITARLAGPGHLPRIVIQSVTRDNLPSFAKSDCLSVTAGVGTFPEPGMAFRPVHDAFGMTRLSQSLVWRDDNHNPALAQFLALARRRYGYGAQ